MNYNYSYSYSYSYSYNYSYIYSYRHSYGYSYSYNYRARKKRPLHFPAYKLVAHWQKRSIFSDHRSARCCMSCRKSQHRCSSAHAQPLFLIALAHPSSSGLIRGLCGLVCGLCID